MFTENIHEGLVVPSIQISMESFHPIDNGQFFPAGDRVLDACSIGHSDPSSILCARISPSPYGEASQESINGPTTVETSATLWPSRTPIVELLSISSEPSSEVDGTVVYVGAVVTHPAHAHLSFKYFIVRKFRVG